MSMSPVQRRLTDHLEANLGPVYDKPGPDGQASTTTQTLWSSALLMTGVFIVLRFAGQIDWVWWALLMPVFLLAAVGVFALIGTKLYEWSEK